MNLADKKEAERIFRKRRNTMMNKTKKCRKWIVTMLLVFLVLSMTIPVFAASGSWKHNSTGWWYSYTDGGYASNKWEKIGNKWYYFDAAGYMQTGWQKISGKWYYLGSNGVMTTGWQKVSGKWYYLGSNGVMVTGTQIIGGKTYQFDSNGVWISDTSYDDYLGYWTYSTDDGSSKEVITLQFISFNGNTATFEIHKFLYNSFGAYGYESPARIGEVSEMTAEISNNTISFQYQDNYENIGHGTITLNGNTVHLKCVVDTYSSWARYDVLSDHDLKKQ